MTPNDILQPGEIPSDSGQDAFIPDAGEGEHTGSSELQGTSSSEEVAALWGEFARHAGTRHISGQGSPGLDRFIKGLVKPKVSWKTLLKRFVSEIFNKHSFKMPNKRFISAGKYMHTLKPTETKGYDNVVVAIDTSGSIGDNELNTFASELLSLFKMYSIANCYIIWCDDSISNIQKLTIDKNKPIDISKLMPRGHGGTSFAEPFKWISGERDVKFSANCPLEARKLAFPRGKYPAFVIYFTDGDNSPLPNPSIVSKYKERVIWIIKGKEEATFIKFGKKIFVDTIT